MTRDVDLGNVWGLCFGIFILGARSFMVATAGGVIFAKLMNVFSQDKINPLLGAAGVSAVPDSARVVQMVGNAEDLVTTCSARHGPECCGGDRLGHSGRGALEFRWLTD